MADEWSVIIAITVSAISAIQFIDHSKFTKLKIGFKKFLIKTKIVNEIKKDDNIEKYTK